MRNSNTQAKQAKSPSRTPRKTFRSGPRKTSTVKQAGLGARNVYYSTLRFGRDAAGAEVWGAEFIDFPGCVSAGDSFEDIVAGAHEALALHVHGMLADHDPIPEPSSRKAADAYSVPEDGEKIFIVPVVVYQLSKVATPAVKVTITMQEGLISDVDAWAAAHNETRSGMIAAAVRERMARR